MTHAEITARHDALRTTFKGGLILMDVSVWNIDLAIRGRALYALAKQRDFDATSDHSYGEFRFAGYLFVWSIEHEDGQLVLTLAAERDLLMEQS